MSFISRLRYKHKKMRRPARFVNLTPEQLLWFHEAARVVQAETCFYCETTFVPPESKHNPRGKTVDHIVPKSSGGPNHPTNYVPACGSCNCERDRSCFIEFAVAKRLQKVYAESTRCVQEAA